MLTEIAEILQITFIHILFSAGAWMECDDLAGPVCKYRLTDPEILDSQIHIVMWERLARPTVTKVLPNTLSGDLVCAETTGSEDTSLAASDISTVEKDMYDQDRVSLGSEIRTSRVSVSELETSLAAEAKLDNLPTALAELKQPMQYNCMNSIEDILNDSIEWSHDVQDMGSKDKLCDRENEAAQSTTNSCDSSNPNCVHTSSIKTVDKDPDNIVSYESSDQKPKDKTSIETQQLKSVTTNSSPCSVLSTESKDSVLLPNFVTSVPDNQNVQRPVPYKFSENNPTSAFEASTVFREAYKNPGTNDAVEIEPHLDSVLKGQQATVGSETAKMQVKVSVISGTVGKIQPSTVFCKPLKLTTASEDGELKGNSTSSICSETTCENNNPGTVDSERMEVNTGMQKMETSEGGNSNSRPHLLKNTYTEGLDKTADDCKVMVRKKDETFTIKLRSMTNNQADGTVKSDSVAMPVMPTTVSVSTPSVNASNVALSQIVTAGNVDGTSGKGHVENMQSESRLRKSGMAFKLPSLRRRKSQNSYMRDAFVTLDKTRGKDNLNNPVASPGFPGAMGGLSSVKQYLLNRATSRSDSKNKFEGLSLASQGAKVPSLATFGSSPYFNSVKLKPSPTSFDTFDLKRKLEKVNSLIVENDQKKIKIDKLNSEGSSESGHASLKENSVCTVPVMSNSLTKRTSRGKKMTLVKQWANQTKGGLPDTRSRISELKLPSKTSPKKTEKAHETDSVLQDLYDALNIPFSSVKDTMSTVMADVDDILQFVDDSELMQLHEETGVSRSCISSPGEGNLMKTDWYVIGS